MNSFPQLSQAIAFLLLLTAAASGIGAEPELRPNIVVILCDDLGYGDLGCYGHDTILTPHLDRLASTGVKLTACYSAAPVCSPSRVGLLTGRSPNRAGVYDWIPPARSAAKDSRDLVHMRKQETTIAHVLQRAGYATCMSGKWHCNSRFNARDQPQPGDAGFDHWFGTQNNAAPSHENPVNYVRNGEKVGPLEGFSCQLAADEAIHWMETRDKKDDDQPFFVYLAFHEPHEPVASPKNLVAKYAPQSKTPDQAQYFANVTNMDQAVGRVVEALDQLGERDNTLVVFSSDNGPETLNRYRSANRSHGTPGPLRGMKLWTTDAGFRVAGILNWPAKIQQPFISDATVSSLDFLPTFCELANGDLPQRTLDGVSFLPLLDGQEIERPRPLIWCYYNSLNEHQVAMRLGRWKMLARLDGGNLPKLQNVNTATSDVVKSAKLTDFELYDVTSDVAESKDLAKQSDSFEELKLAMQRAYQELVSSSHVWQASPK